MMTTDGQGKVLRCLQDFIPNEMALDLFSALLIHNLCETMLSKKFDTFKTRMISLKFPWFSTRDCVMLQAILAFQIGKASIQ